MGFQIDTGQMALLANQVAAFGKSANQKPVNMKTL